MSTAPTKSMETLRRRNGRTALHYLRRKWVLLGAAGLALIVAVALSWNWLVAIGVASVLLSVLPCLVMCGLGLCMHKFIGGSGSAQAASTERQAPTEGNRALDYVTSCCGAGSVGSSAPANAPAEGASQPKDNTHA